jgi:ribonucleoside-diphosphate reductase alpha chain
MIQVDYSKDNKFDLHGLLRLRESYLRQDEHSPQDRYAFVAKSFGSNKEHAQRMYNYMSDHWFSPSTPVLSFGRTTNGLPISCFLPYLNDTSDGLLDTSTECRVLSMSGGGIGLGVGIRSSDSKSTGVMPHLRTYDDDTLAYRQGSTRRGSIAAYLDITHPDIFRFLEMRKPTGGDPNSKCLNLHHGINIPDTFMERVWALSTGTYSDGCLIPYNSELKAELEKWPLIDPHSGEVKDIVSVKELWQRILSLRMQTGEPYLHFIDTSNRSVPLSQIKLGLKIKQSNLCTEITLPTDEERTAVCCLGSVNVEYFDSWVGNEQFIADIIEFLDNILQFFIDNAPDRIARARYSAMRERSLGLGQLGFHAYLQQRLVPFESPVAFSISRNIAKHIYERAKSATKNLAVLRGECPDALGSGVRNMCVLAIAPNASSSIIVGNTSPSVEPFRANIFIQDTMSGSQVFKNKYLEQLLERKGCNTPEVWAEITKNNGSVLTLDCLSEYEKDVFKTAIEIDQQWIIELAAERQKYIDQAQSINLFFEPSVSIEYLHNVHLQAWKKGLKTLYYCRSTAIKRAEKVGHLIKRQIIDEENCLACEG